MTQRETVEVHYILEGPEDAPVLALANSLGTTLEMWDDQAEALRDRFRLLRYDHRGHGGSPVPSGPYAIDDLGRDASDAEAARAFGLPPGTKAQQYDG